MSLSRKLNLAVKKLLGDRLARHRPRPIELKACRKILILELWGLGDFVFAAPAAKALLQAVAGAEIDMLVQPSIRPLAEAMGLPVRPIYHAFPWTRFTNKYSPREYLRPSLWKLLFRLRKRRYDLILSVRTDPRDAVLARFLSPRHSLGFAAFGSPLFYTSSLAPVREHKTEAWFRLLAFLGIGASARETFRSLQSESRARLPPPRNAPPEKAIVLHCSARNPVRSWGFSRFVELGSLLEADGYQILWLRDPNSRDDLARLPGTWKIVEGGLTEVLSLLSSARLYVGNDGGLMHMADLFGAKVCCVFGPTDPVFFHPYGQPDALVFVPEVACRPCYDYCIYPKPICFDGLSAQLVRRKVLESLTGTVQA